MKETSTVSTEDIEVSEGGWSWLIVFAVALNKMAFWGVLPCFGIVFADVLDTRPKQEGASVASIVGIFLICLQVIGLFCPALFRTMSRRVVGTIGGLIYLAGSVASSFSVSIMQMILAFSVVQGIGYGMMLSASLACFNEHFRRRRTMAMAMAQCVNGAGSLAFPLALQKLQATAGSRAAKLAVSALCAAAAASQLLLKPPVSFPGNSLKLHSGVKTADDDVPCQHITPEETFGLIEHKEKTLPVVVTNADSRNLKRTARSENIRRVLACAWRWSGISSDTMRDWQVLVMAAGTAVVHLGDINFFAMLPLHLRALRMEELRVAQTITAATAGDFAGRVLLLVIGPWLGSRNRIVFAGSAFVSAVAIFAVTFVTSWTQLLVFIVILGVGKGLIYVTMFLTIAEIVPPNKFPSALVVVFILHTITALCSPLIGLVRDVSGSYPVCFQLIAGLIALCPLVWSMRAVQWART